MKNRSSLRVPVVLAVVLFGLAVGMVSSCSKKTTGVDVKKQTGGTVARTGGGVSGAGGSGGAKAPNPDGGGTDAKIAVNCEQVQGDKSKATGTACDCDSECQSGYCANGYCCSSACKEKCKACNVPTALGQCTFLPAGVRPTTLSECPAEAKATCGLDGTCDGKGGCRDWPEGTDCQSGTCAGDVVLDAKVCDGKGACNQTKTTKCLPYSCDSKQNPKACFTSCKVDGDCASGQRCLDGSCGKKINGALATSGSECVSGFAADGVCCDGSCSQACSRCNLPGKLGTCSPIGSGQTDSRCNGGPPSTCGYTGSCDERARCTRYPANTPCGNAACTSSTTASDSRTCDGKGTCQAANVLNCAPYLCSNGHCQSGCKSDADCEAGRKCDPSGNGGNGSCGKKLNGQSCTAMSECDSGQCVDGVCCESECSGACRSCALPGSLGKCAMAAAGATDPRNTCKDQGVTSCGTTGVCDGSGACASYAEGDVCGESTCKDGVYTPPSTCNAAGQCVASRAITCVPYRCKDDKVCFKECTTNSQCADGEVCTVSEASCGKNPNGASCSGGSECKSGICAQGVCCNFECSEACKSCNQVVALGSCTNVPDGLQDPQGKCESTIDDPTCGYTGTCQNGSCAYTDKGIHCKDSSCETTSSEIRESTCDGSGLCSTPEANSCGTFICAANACKNSCTSDKDCVPPNSCVNGSCGPKRNGMPCTAGKECDSGFCTEGVCCDTACSDATTGGLCKSCKVTGKVGTCTPVPSGGVDPKGLCKASDAAKGDCTNSGTCNGAGACKPWESTKGCRQASCVGTTLTMAANCDGKGACPAADLRDCDPYVCSKTSPSCLNTCTTAADCKTLIPPAVPYTCLATTNKCNGPLPPGEVCEQNSDCKSGFCVDGRCCESACSGGCQTCALNSSNYGKCLNRPNGAQPRLGSNACAPTSNTCGNTGLCNGSNGCQQAANTKTCGSPSCAAPVSGTLDGQTVSQSVASIPAPLCNGSGVCVVQAAESCDEFQCNASTGLCKSSCLSSSADCYSIAPATSGGPGGNSCVGTTCQKKPNGYTCTNGFACVSGNCVDGICCSASSCGTCQACNLAGSLGTCKTVAAGEPEPHGLCAANPPCGNTGACTAAGTCAQASATTACTVTQSCTNGIMSGGTSTCTGTGSCAAVADQPCGAYKCSGTTCATSCTNDTVCAAGYRCDGSACKKAEGQSCSSATAGSECASGNCVSNGAGAFICCSVACTEEACGTKAACNTASTGTAGIGCQTHSGEICGTASCTDGSAITTGTCNGSGQCTGQVTSTCSPFVCNGPTCGTACTPNTTTGCAAGYMCNSAGTACKIPDGKACTGNTDCLNNNCVATGVGTDKVCCATACTNSDSCGSTAYCLPDVGTCKPHAVDDACTGTAGCTADLTSRIPAAGTCQGAPLACSQTPTVSCLGFACSAGACLTSCTEGTSTGCPTGKVCSGGVCKTPVSDGGECTLDNDCVNKNCVGTMCCSVACPGSECVKAQCKAGGVGCEPEPNTTECRALGCVNTTTVQLQSFCDGAGVCSSQTLACEIGQTCDALSGTCIPAH